jgi:hypothetical protein
MRQKKFRLHNSFFRGRGRITQPRIGNFQVNLWQKPLGSVLGGKLSFLFAMLTSLPWLIKQSRKLMVQIPYYSTIE